jgi:amino acid adenylation domain-containing protein
VIYTSGSTGVPKGVKITHSNLGHYLQAMRSALGIAATDRCLHTASFSFSSAVRQLLLPLSCGATVVIATADELRDPLLLFETVRREGVSVVDLVPSYLRVATGILADLEPQARRELLDNRLRLILSASETLHADLPYRWAAELRHGARFFNMYGQTETTGIVTLYEIPPSTAPSTQAMPVGKPIAGARVDVLDPAGRPVPAGVPGEIWIGGATVGQGYLDEALTVARFRPDPFDATPGARLYRTGDRGRIRGDGNLEHLGRLDDQVKVRGFRIEPAEIEAILNAHPQVLESVVVVDATATGGKRLVAAVVKRGVEADDPSFAKRLRDHLKAKLPDYMVPAVVVELATLPRTPGGKLDRNAVLTRPA